MEKSLLKSITTEPVIYLPTMAIALRTGKA